MKDNKKGDSDMTIYEILEIEDNVIMNTDNIQVSEVETDGGYPDFSDSMITEAEVNDNGKWRFATDDELDIINEDSEFVYEEVLNFTF